MYSAVPPGSATYARSCRALPSSRLKRPAKANPCVRLPSFPGSRRTLFSISCGAVSFTPAALMEPVIERVSGEVNQVSPAG